MALLQRKFVATAHQTSLRLGHPVEEALPTLVPSALQSLKHVCRAVGQAKSASRARMRTAVLHVMPAAQIVR